MVFICGKYKILGCQSRGGSRKKSAVISGGFISTKLMEAASFKLRGTSNMGPGTRNKQQGTSSIPFLKLFTIFGV
jgi:hypothetical protein